VEEGIFDSMKTLAEASVRKLVKVCDSNGSRTV